MGGYKYRVFLRKRPGLQNGVRLQGVSAYKGCPLGGVRLYIYLFCRVEFSVHKQRLNVRLREITIQHIMHTKWK